ncbi:uncharacterized protein Dwil_GK26945 [Drosophila willistoni]|uniref:Uncharacterized protein n=1 Tax=Drosophila willistoni TaxID=7260 RepID=A0A0Q9WTL1_DROWI|nr:uncharacterized protein Dwil_GK26945 [Drosophila willistoni]
MFEIFFTSKHEQHELYFGASGDRGYRLKFTTVKEQKDHCITEHKLPANYRFN